jgi:hypothetical protein
MSGLSPDRRQLRRLSSALDSVQQALEGDLASLRQMPERQIAEVLRRRTQVSHARADALLERVVALREIVLVRVRTLQRLRARMHQLSGGTRPH